MEKKRVGKAGVEAAGGQPPGRGGIRAKGCKGAEGAVRSSGGQGSLQAEGPVWLGAERMGEQGGRRGRSPSPPPAGLAVTTTTSALPTAGDVGAAALCEGNRRWGICCSRGSLQGAGRLGGERLGDGVRDGGAGGMEVGSRVDGDVISRNLKDSFRPCAPRASPGADVPTPGVPPGRHPWTAHGGPRVSVSSAGRHPAPRQRQCCQQPQGWVTVSVS